MNNLTLRSAVCGFLAIALMFISCAAYAEQSAKTVLFENDMLKIVYNGNCTMEDPSEMYQVETFGLDMETFQFEAIETAMDFFPAAHLEVVIENKSAMDLAINLEGGTINGWSIDPNQASFEYAHVNKGSKLKTTLDLYNTDFLYEIHTPEDLETLQLDLVIYEDRKTSLLVLGHVSSESVELNAGN